MSITVGDNMPGGVMMTMGESGPTPVDMAEFFKGKKVILVSVPGAFTPTCSAKHLPGFVENADALKTKGVDTIACMAVNDAFVMGAWGKDQGVGDKIVMLGDGNGDYTKALDLVLDGTGFGMGYRGKRFAIIVDDGKVVKVNVEEPGAFEVSSAEYVLGQL